VTTHITSDLCPVPLLWVMPLSLYLLTFAIAFARPPGPLRRGLVWILPVLIVLPIAASYWHVPWRRALPFEMSLHLASFAAIAIVCHQELAARKPAAAASTEFQFWVAFGGVLGGAFNALIAPLIFSTLIEYTLVLVFAGLVMPQWKHRWPSLSGREWELGTI